MLNKFLIIYWMVFSFISVRKTINYHGSDTPTASNGIVINLPKTLLLIHITTIYLLYTYLTFMPYIPIFRLDSYFLTAVQLINYILIIPYHDKILTIKGQKAVFLNHFASIMNMIILLNIRKNKYMRFIILIFLNLEGIVPLLIKDVKKYILNAKRVNKKITF